MENIQGMVEHIVYHNEENGYTVFQISCSGSEVTCVANIPTLDEGEYLDLEGEYVNHKVYGKQFRVISASSRIPEEAYAIERYLGSGAIKGIGVKVAERIVKKFGADSFRIIEEEPEKLAEVKGISVRKAQDIFRQFHEKQGMRKSIMFLSEYGITMNMAVKIYKEYGEDMYSIIRENPYRLADDITGIGFKIADDIAMKAGISTDSDFRIRSGLLYMLGQSTLSGHTYVPFDLLVRETAQLLNVDEDITAEQITALMMDRRVVVKDIDDRKVVYASSLFFTELETAGLLKRLAVKTPADKDHVLSLTSIIEKNENIRLDVLQKEAVMNAAENGVFILTGGPGTGKTTTINTIIKYFENEKADILLAAPTGRAAKRMSEATGCEAKTIHRLLELTVSDETEGSLSYRFERNEMNPLDADVVIIDEMSMVDIFLIHALLKALTQGTKLIMVGDVDQLPSVGPGNVLKDILDSGQFTSIKLTHIFRQALESSIVKNAHMINEGKHIDPGVNTEDFFCIKRYSTPDILGVLAVLIRDKLPTYLNVQASDIQVLTPMRKGELGVERLNEVLQEYLNPPSDEKKETDFHNGKIRQGDKVMQIKNNYQIEWEILGLYNIPVEKGIGVFNGDIGIVKDINQFTKELVVEFDDEKIVHYSFSDFDELELAYAVTIHKSQGSEYPAVILPLLKGPQMLFNRNLLYTAVTRAKKCVAIIGDERTLLGMIDNEREQSRYTSLDLRIKESYAREDSF